MIPHYSSVKKVSFATSKVRKQLFNLWVYVPRTPSLMYVYLELSNDVEVQILAKSFLVKSFHSEEKERSYQRFPCSQICASPYQCLCLRFDASMSLHLIYSSTCCLFTCRTRALHLHRYLQTRVNHIAH